VNAEEEKEQGGLKKGEFVVQGGAKNTVKSKLKKWGRRRAGPQGKPPEGYGSAMEGGHSISARPGRKKGRKLTLMGRKRKTGFQVEGSKNRSRGGEETVGVSWNEKKRIPPSKEGEKGK